MYAVCVKIDETLPWIELKGSYQTIKEARKAVQKLRNNMQMKAMSVLEERRPMKLRPPSK